MATAASLLGLALMIGGLGGLILRHDVLTASAPVVLLQVLAVALMVWARRTFGRRSFHATASPTAGGLVTTGPYGWIRHPIYTAVCLFGWACWVGHPSWLSAALAGVVTAGAVARLLAEESLLVARYPEYAAYARTTKRMVPYLF